MVIKTYAGFWSLFLVFCLCAGSAAASSTPASFYLRGFGGITDLQDVGLDFTDPLTGASAETILSADAGQVVGLAGGVDLGPVRFEAEIAQRQNALKTVENKNTSPPAAQVRTVTPASGNVSSWAFVLAMYGDFENASRFTPYLGAGAGFGRVEVSGPISDSDLIPLCQLGTGVDVKLSDHFGVDLGYRYLVGLALDLAGLSGSYQVHNASLGLRYTF